MNSPHTDVSSVFRHAKAKEVRDPYDGLRPWSAITHGIGVGLAFVGTAVIFFHFLGNLRAFVPFLIYGLSMVGLYLASTLYHSLNTPVAGRIALRKYDHCSIYLLIAGSYTPICLTVLRDGCGPVLLAFIWIAAIAGIVLTICKLSIPRWLTSAIYLVMGWASVLAVVPLFLALPRSSFFWLLAGGLLYTVGGILYAVKWPLRSNPVFGCHEIFHVFILLGSVCQFVMICRLAFSL